MVSDALGELVIKVSDVVRVYFMKDIGNLHVYVYYLSWTFGVQVFNEFYSVVIVVI